MIQLFGQQAQADILRIDYRLVLEGHNGIPYHKFDILQVRFVGQIVVSGVIEWQTPSIHFLILCYE